MDQRESDRRDVESARREIEAEAPPETNPYSSALTTVAAVLGIAAGLFLVFAYFKANPTDEYVPPGDPFLLLMIALAFGAAAFIALMSLLVLDGVLWALRRLESKE